MYFFPGGLKRSTNNVISSELSLLGNYHAYTIAIEQDLAELLLPRRIVFSDIFENHIHIVIKPDQSSREFYHIS